MSGWMIVIEGRYYCKWHADVTEPFVAQYVPCSLSSHSLWPAASTGSSVWLCLHITPLYVLLHYRMIRDTLSGAVKVSRDESHLHEFRNVKETASCC